MTAADVQSLLGSCDRGTALGVRDFVMMLLVARLGLRSVEVARLELRDVDWRAGEIVVRGKGGREPVRSLVYGRCDESRVCRLDCEPGEEHGCPP